MPNKTWSMNVDLLPNTTGTFKLGTAEKQWTVNGYTLGAACAKSVTDNTSSTAASSTDQNLITGRTLYYALDNIGLSAITDNQIDALFS